MTWDDARDLASSTFVADPSDCDFGIEQRNAGNESDGQWDVTDTLRGEVIAGPYERRSHAMEIAILMSAVRIYDQENA